MEFNKRDLLHRHARRPHRPWRVGNCDARNHHRLFGELHGQRRRTATVRATVVVVPRGPPTVSLSANPTSVTAGQSATVTWSSTNATSCAGTRGGLIALGGSVTATPAITTVYSVSCTGSGGAATVSATVVVVPRGPPTVSLSANPTSITAGQSSTVTWSSTNATSCTGTRGGLIALGGSVTATPAITTVYSVSCTGSGGAATVSATVVVVPRGPPTVSLSANPTSITAGQSSTVTWSSTNATSCTGTRGGRHRPWRVGNCDARNHHRLFGELHGQRRRRDS